MKIPRILASFDQRNRRIYVNHVDVERQLVQFFYFGLAERSEVAAAVDGQPAPLLHQSKRETKPDGSAFTHRHFFWLRIDMASDVAIQIGGRPRVLRCRSVSLGKKVKGKDIHATYRWEHLNGSIAATLTGAKQVREIAQAPDVRGRFANAWVFMDRDDKADDNAEHLYKYVRETDPGRPIFYVIRRNVPDWDRLGREKFNLLEFGSDEHRLVLANASVLASSHLTKPMLFPFKKNIKAWKQLLNHKIVFLQHGTTLADNSRMFNNKNIDMFVVTTEAERDSIAEERTNYILTDKEVALTGFPRHDALLKMPTGSRHILVMPTWRRTLTGSATGDGLQRGKVQGFRDTSFCRNWSAFLKSESLKLLAEKTGKEIVFAPHPNLMPYLDDLELPNHVRVYNQFSDGALQEYFASSAVLVTDYSSVAFDVAYLLKPVVYFQFDAATIYTDHLPKGYFDFERDGFGPVCTTANEAVLKVEQALAGNADSKYQVRQLLTFPLRDGKCCERIYRRILDMLGEH